MDLYAHDRMIHHSLSHSGYTAGVSARTVKTRSISRMRRSVSSVVRPKPPLAVAGLVLTFQSSTMFWGTAELAATREEIPGCLADRVVFRVVALEQPEQDVGVDEVAHQLCSR